jgi:DNA-binding NarL/FixJ family response regulator
MMRRVSHRERSEVAVDHILRTLKAYGLTKEIHEASKEAAARGEGPPVPSDALSALSQRELEVLGLLARGLSTEAIAERLGISPLTVRSHIRDMLRKMGLHSRTEAVSIALRNGLL